MMARKPAAETAAAVKAPEIDAATVRAAKVIASTRSTRAASGLWILLVTPMFCFHRPPVRRDVS